MTSEEKSSEKGLTVEKLKKMQGFEHLTDEQAAQVVASIKKFVRILLKVGPLPEPPENPANC